jgi:hypothetical protein
MTLAIARFPPPQVQDIPQHHALAERRERRPAAIRTHRRDAHRNFEANRQIGNIMLSVYDIARPW